MTLRSIDPATEELIAEYDEHDEQELARRVECADRAYRRWRETPLAERAAKVRALGRILRDQNDEWADLMTREMGKPIAQAEAEVEKCAWVCDYYADHARAFLAPEMVETDASTSGVRFDPLGPILAIMPWNFPFWQVVRFAAPALVAGNVALLKHSENVPGCALALEEIFREAGFPEGVFTTLLTTPERAPDLIGHELVRGVTLTGSVRAGRAVAAEAGKHLKKLVLELGGSDPFIVLEDCDPEDVAEHAVAGRTLNSGQSCIAAKRFLVAEGLADDFEEALARRMAELEVGDPANRTVEVGPLARLDLLENLHDQVERSVDAGATVATGGKRLDRRGFFYVPTMLTGVGPGMAAFDEETFGPVAAVIRVSDADHAVELANLSTLGLGASIWTEDAALAERMVARIDSGSVFVNGVVKSDPRLPFGGVKDSGYGRELSLYGLREWVNVKTFWVR